MAERQLGILIIKCCLITLLILLITIPVALAATKFTMKELWSIALPEAGTLGHVTALDYGDVNGDGYPDIGVVCVEGPVYGGHDGDSKSYLYVIKNDGTLLFKKDLVNYGFRNSARSISLSDIDNDGKSEIIVGGGILIGGPLSLVVFDDNGKKLWSFSAPVDRGNRATAIFLSTIDIDGDGKLETFEATGDWESSVSRMFDTNGDLIWQKTFGETSQLGIADLNSDGKPEFLLGTSLGANPRTLFVFDKNGNVLWKKTFVGYVKFAVKDVTGDDIPEVIVCAGDTDTSWKGQFYVLRNDGSIVFQSEVWRGLQSNVDPPLIIDLNGDGVNDIIVTRPIKEIARGVYKKAITAYKSSGNTFAKLWTSYVTSSFGEYPALFKFNGHKYILMISTEGKILKINFDGSLEEFFTLSLPYRWPHSPYIGWYEVTKERTETPVFMTVDIDSDGVEEIPIVVRENGQIYLKVMKVMTTQVTTPTPIITTLKLESKLCYEDLAKIAEANSKTYESLAYFANHELEARYRAWKNAMDTIKESIGIEELLLESLVPETAIYFSVNSLIKSTKAITESMELVTTIGYVCGRPLDPCHLEFTPKLDYCNSPETAYDAEFIEYLKSNSLYGINIYEFFYETYGYPTHLTIQLLYLSWLCEKEKESWKNKDIEAAKKWMEKRKEFIDSMLLWLQDAEDAYAMTCPNKELKNYYKNVIIKTRDYIKSDKNYIESLEKTLKITEPVECKSKEGEKKIPGFEALLFISSLILLLILRKSF